MSCILFGQKRTPMFEVTGRGRKPVSFLTAQTTYQRLEESTLPHTWVGSPEPLSLHPVPYCPASRDRSDPTPGDSMPLCPGLNRVQGARRDPRPLCGLLVLGPGKCLSYPQNTCPSCKLRFILLKALLWKRPKGPHQDELRPCWRKGLNEPPVEKWVRGGDSRAKSKRS